MVYGLACMHTERITSCKMRSLVHSISQGLEQDKTHDPSRLGQALMGSRRCVRGTLRFDP